MTDSVICPRNDLVCMCITVCKKLEEIRWLIVSQKWNFYHPITVLQTSNCFIVISISLLEIDKTLILSFTGAAARGYISTMIEMLHAGVPVDSVDENGWTALTVAAFWNRTDVTRVLLQRGVDVDKQSGYYHSTALHRAAWDNCTDVIKLLLEHGASTKIKDHYGRTPIDLARERKKEAAIRLLERH